MWSISIDFEKLKQRKGLRRYLSCKQKNILLRYSEQNKSDTLLVLYLFLQIISSSYLLIMCVCVRFHLNGGIPWSGNWYLRRIGLKRVGSEIISNNTGTKIPFFLTFILKRIFISFSLSIHFKQNLQIITILYLTDMSRWSCYFTCLTFVATKRM